MTFIEVSSASRMKLPASQRQTLVHLCSVSGDFNPGSFITLASGGHLISRLFLEAQLQFVSLKWGCWIVSSTKDKLSLFEEKDKQSLRTYKALSYAQSHRPVFVLIFVCSACLGHLPTDIWFILQGCSIKYRFNGLLNLSIFPVGPAPSFQS